jgi:hypothetical protein
VHSLWAVIKFLSAFRAKTDSKSSTYNSRYWLAGGIDRMSCLYVAMTSSWRALLAGVLVVKTDPRRGYPSAYPKHPETVRIMESARSRRNARMKTTHTVVQIMRYHRFLPRAENQEDDSDIDDDSRAFESNTSEIRSQHHVQCNAPSSSPAPSHTKKNEMVTWAGIGSQNLPVAVSRKLPANLASACSTHLL